jgi:protein arginine N-methyltransferase 5
VFEQDNAKYDEYEMALQRALLVFPADHRVVIFYIGCGRGQLIYSCVNASKKTNRNIVVYAIEKNPYPIQTLKRRIAKNKWVNLVHIVESDVRDWQPEMQADIFLSELLGGFGDN